MESSDALAALRAVHMSRHTLGVIRKLRVPFKTSTQKDSDNDFWVAPSARETARGAFLLDEALYRAKDGILVRNPCMKPSWDKMNARGSTIHGHNRTSSCAAEAKRTKVRITQKWKKVVADRTIVKDTEKRRWKEKRVIPKAEEVACAMGFTTSKLPVTPPRRMRTACDVPLLATPSTMNTPELSFSASSDSESHGSCSSCQLDDMFELYINSSACGMS
ncbi:hypothetical protein BDQ17DRAFT_1340432 [Cyathus striatus]|nr:hypothetical protein BDQ17DRAFT_1340432 [Cyathus striatus]